ncbi:MAG: AbgT family transporter [Sphingomonas sp.]
METRERATNRGWLDRIERLGNALPDPAFIFVALILLVMLVSLMGAGAGWSALNPSNGKPILVESLFSAANLRRLLTEMPQTLTAFPPLGFVLVVMLGAAVSERAGLFAALIGGAVRRLPVRYLTPCTYLVGIFSHQAADAAYVVLIPLAAIVYAEAGRHPLMGIAAAYVGISGAFAGNAIPGQFDVLMLGITQAAAQLLVPGYPLNPLGNWWFSAALGLGLTPVVWFVGDRIVEPRLAAWKPDGPGAELAPPIGRLTTRQQRGLNQAGLAAIVIVGMFAALTLWPGFHPLIDDQASGAARLTPFYMALIAGFFLLFFTAGWAYGSAAGTIGSHRDVVRMMGDGVRDLAPYVVIVFFAAHFVALFSWSNLGPVMAIKGAEQLRELALPLPLMLVTLLVLSSVFDLLIGSASAKWSVMAPIAVPLLMLLGVSPEMTTAAYRMGDSIFNIVTPVASNFVLVLVMCQRWVKGFGVGSLMAMMLPFSIAIGLYGLVLVCGWAGLGLPVGPGAPAVYQIPVVR